MSKIDVFNDHTYASRDFFEYMRTVENAMSGDINLVVTPSTLGSSATKVNAAIAGDEGKFIRIVVFKLKDTAGNIHSWFNGDISISVAETTAGSGVAAISEEATKVTLIEGVGSIDIEYTGEWAAADTCTLTTTQKTIMGVTIAAKTSVDTLVA